MTYMLHPLSRNFKLLPIIGLASFVILTTSLISIAIPFILLALTLIFFIIKDFRVGTALLIVFAFTSIAAQELFESYHMFLLLATITIFSLYLSVLKQNTPIKGIKEFNSLFIIFGIWAFLSGVIATDHMYWILNIELMLRALILFFLIYNSFSTKREIFLIFKIIVLSIFLSSLISYIVAFGGLSISLRNLMPLFLHRFTGSVLDPNYFSMTVAAALPLAIVLVIKEKNWIVRFAWILSALFLLFAIIISQSRTGLVSAAVVFLYTIYYLIQRRRREILFLIIPLVILIILVPPAFWYRLSLFWQYVTTGAGGEVSAMLRLNLLSYAFDVFIKNPIFGVGLGNFEVIAARYTQYPMVCHNSYLEIAAGLGMLGLIPFLLILYKGFRVLKKAVRYDETSELAWGIRAGLLSSYVALLFLSVPFKLDFWILLALSAVLSRCKVLENVR